MLMRSLSRRGSKLDKNPTPPPAEEDDGRVNVRAYNKKVRRGSPDSSAPPQTRMPRAGAESAADGVVIAVNGRGDEVAMGRMADDAAAAQEAETVELAE